MASVPGWTRSRIAWTVAAVVVIAGGYLLTASDDDGTTADGDRFEVAADDGDLDGDGATGDAEDRDDDAGDLGHATPDPADDEVRDGSDGSSDDPDDPILDGDDARGPPDDELPRYSDLPTVSLDELPPEALDTLDLIERGGPFPYRQDDSTFQNREGILPDRALGHYREYTVDTPGSPDRGARRIVGGDDGERYYTDDHYASFREIVFD